MFVGQKRSSIEYRDLRYPAFVFNFPQGRDVFHEHVKQYKLAFSSDGSNFNVYKEDGKERVMICYAWIIENPSSV